MRMHWEMCVCRCDKEVQEEQLRPGGMQTTKGKALGEKASKDRRRKITLEY